MSSDFRFSYGSMHSDVASAEPFASTAYFHVNARSCGTDSSCSLSSVERLAGMPEVNRKSESNNVCEGMGADTERTDGD